MTKRIYPCDLSDGEYKYLKKCFPKQRNFGRPPAPHAARDFERHLLFARNRLRVAVFTTRIILVGKRFIIIFGCGAKRVGGRKPTKDCADCDESGKANYYAYAIRAWNKHLLKDSVGAMEDVITIIEINPAEYSEFGTLYFALNNLKNDKNIFVYYERLFEVLERQAKYVEKNPPRVFENEDINQNNTNAVIEKLNDNLRYFMLQCAALYEERGQIKIARKLFERVITIGTKTSGYLTRAEFYKQIGKGFIKIRNL